MASDLVFNTFEAPSSGTSLSASSGSGPDGSTAWINATIPSGGTLATDNTHALFGSQALKAATGATASICYANWDNTVGPLSNSQFTMWTRAYHYWTGNPASSCQMLRLLGASNGTAGSYAINNSGHIVGQNAAGTVLVTSTNAITANQWFRVEMKVVVATTSTGLIEVKLFLTPNSTVADETLTSAATQNMGTTAIQGLRVGVLSATASLGPYWTDEVAVSDLAYIGPSPQAYNLPSIDGPYRVVAPVRAASY